MNFSDMLANTHTHMCLYMIQTMTNDHVIGFGEKKRECRIDLSSYRIYNKIVAFVILSMR
jgi:hypothetical protein